MKSIRQITFLVLALFLLFSLPVVANGIDTPLIPVPGEEDSELLIGSFYYTLSGTSATVVGYAGWQTDPSLPKTVTHEGTVYTVTAIGDSAFAADNNITSVAVSKNVTSVAANAFNGCTKLADVWFEGTASDKAAITVPPHEELPKGFVEPHACQLPDGTIIGALRISIEGYPGKLRTYLTFSHDDGKTWTKPEPMEGVYGSTPHFLLHSSGALILVYQRRRVDPQGQYARISRDGGKTWGKDFLVSPVAPDWDHGYPSSVELANGDVFTMYYQKYDGDDYPSLLGTRWSLDEEPK